MRAYLSGAIEHATDGGSSWRNEISKWLKNRLGHKVFNPVTAEPLSNKERENFRAWRITDYPKFKQTIRKLIDHDLQNLINEIDYIICYWDKGVLKGAGTHGEVTTAYYHKIPVYTVMGMAKSEVSSWILGCTTQEFDDFDDLKIFLLQKYGK
ncbi:MAG: hypothetical protein IIA61_11035 [Candidatus Marinimicrobia bacterium]|nr:hypothetical protein [Candidatus Neomarinimicrobiota bacterium]